MRTASFDELQNIWSKVRADRDGAKTFTALKDAGFNLEQIEFNPRSLPWEIVNIPFLPNRRARSRALVMPETARLVVRSLNEIADAFVDPHSELEARDTENVIYTKAGVAREFANFRALASSLEKIRACHWVVTEHNPRQLAIANLRWETKSRTGQAHDAEIDLLLHSVFRAAGKNLRAEFGGAGRATRLDVLKKTEDHERATRKSGRAKLRNL